MIPGRYTLALTENSTNVFTFTISGITTAVGYSAAIDIRDSELPTSTIRLALTSSAGIALSSNGSVLSVVVTITETQIDTLAPLITSTTTWSLKITAPATTTLQYLKGAVTVTRTPTA